MKKLLGSATGDGGETVSRASSEMVGLEGGSPSGAYTEEEAHG